MECVSKFSDEAGSSGRGKGDDSDDDSDSDSGGSEDDESEGPSDGGVSVLLGGLSSAHTFAVGYDDGRIGIFDKRAALEGGAPAVEFDKQTDFVSDLALAGPSGHQLVSSSGDGTVALFDIRKGKMVARSEDDADDEMLSLCVMKGGKKVVCGHQSGVIGIYSWGYWNDCSDRFPGHPGSVDTMAKVDEDVLLTGSSDGLIRIVSVLPNKALGVVGEHLADTPIEKLCLEPRQSRTLLSISHDNIVKFWSVGELLDSDDDEDGDGGDGGDGGNGDGAGSGSDSDSDELPSKKKRKKGKKSGGKAGFKSSAQAQRSAFFADM